MNNINHISIVISTRNSAQYIERCLDSAISQDYPDYEIIFLDAQSTDGTYEKAKSYEGKFENIKVIQNEKRKYQGENLRIGSQLSPEKSIIITLDGDDYFPHDAVLARINKEYQKRDCWMTYGTYVEFPLRDISHLYHEYPLEVRKNKTFRQHRWLGTHLRTFRRELFLNIKEDDLKDPITGDYYANVCDLTFQFPMLEMCGIEKSIYIPDILYVYNMENQESDFRKDRAEADRMEASIRSMTPYETLENLYDEKN